MRDYYYLTGLIELKKKNHSGAIENINKALSLYPYHQGSFHTLLFNSLALAYFKSGEMHKAQEEYEKITSLTIPRYYYGDIYAKSFYMLGKIYEQQGNKAKAIEHYEKFLTLWKDADPGIPEVEDAKKKLARLKAQ